VVLAACKDVRDATSTTDILIDVRFKVRKGNTISRCEI
jgi:ABC-type iron transport system FetAB ATPase subunit